MSFVLKHGSMHWRLRARLYVHVTGNAYRHVDDVISRVVVGEGRFSGDGQRRRHGVKDAAVGALAVQFLLFHSSILKPRLHLRPENINYNSNNNNNNNSAWK